MLNKIIIGGGPCGLTLAWYAAKNEQHVVVVEREKELGGCHRVKRVNGQFTEHAPRLYSSSYVNFVALLKDMNLKFEEFFTPYNIGLSHMTGNAFHNLNWMDAIHITSALLYFLFWGTFPGTVLDFAEKHNMTKTSMEYLDRLCRLTDGAGIEKYSMFQFMQLVNQQGLHGLFQPKVPMERLFESWKKKLEETGFVTFVTGQKVSSVVKEGDRVLAVMLDSGEIIEAEEFVLAIPPVSVRALIENGPCQDAFMGSFTTFSDWVNETEYGDYISITYRWKDKLSLPNVWGFPSPEWGVAFIVTTDYSSGVEEESQTIISTSITKPNSVSTYTSKTAQESSADEMVVEVFRQLQSFFPGLLPPYDGALMCPNLYREEGTWESKDGSFVASGRLTNPFLKAQSDMYLNLSTVGSHNGHSKYAFTSMESAISNAMHFMGEPVHSALTAREMCAWLVIGLCTGTVLLNTSLRSKS